MISGSEPIQISLIENPDGIQFKNSTLIWSNINSKAETNTIKFQAQNTIGTDYLAFKLNIKQKYLIIFNNITQNMFYKMDPVLITGSLRLKSNPSMRLNRSTSFSLKLKRSYYNDLLNIRINSQSDGSFFYRYSPSPNEFGSYSLDAKNDLDLSEFNPQVTWFYLGNL